MHGVSAVHGCCMDVVWIVYEECMEVCNANYPNSYLGLENERAFKEVGPFTC